MSALPTMGSEGIPLHEVEQKVLGFTHCETGNLLAG